MPASKTKKTALKKTALKKTAPAGSAVRPKAPCIKAAADISGAGFRLADPMWNAREILAALEMYEAFGVSVVVFPELCITGASCGDLFRQDILLDAAQKAVRFLLKETANSPVTFVVGLPERARSGVLYAVTLCIRAGKIVARNRKPLDAPPTVFAPIELVSTRRKRAPERLILCPSAVPSALMGPADFRSFALDAAKEHQADFILASPKSGESVTDGFYGMPVCCGVMVKDGESVLSDLSDPCPALEFPAAFEPAKKQYLLKFEEDRKRLAALGRDPLPFLPKDRAGTIWIAAALESALAQRMTTARADKLVIGVSGGLDSTLALLVSHEAVASLNLPASSVIAISMPGFGTTSRTKNNAARLAKLLGCDCRTVDIRPACLQHFADIGHDPEVADVVFENAQARERTQILMDVANGSNALVIGTGDLSEIALGWCTYNGDHMSMYAVNSGVPKTLVRHLVAFYAEGHGGMIAPVLQDILDTPVSPELVPASKNGESGHRTEQILGAYELHDFYLFHLVRLNESPRAILRKAKKVFDGKYPPEEIRRTLELFLRRFFSQQFKRSCSPDGPAVSPLSLSPRSGWRVPSDASPALWLDDLK